jgi:hypothetical protein
LFHFKVLPLADCFCQQFFDVLDLLAVLLVFASEHVAFFDEFGVLVEDGVDVVLSDFLQLVRGHLDEVELLCHPLALTEQFVVDFVGLVLLEFNNILDVIVCYAFLLLDLFELFFFLGVFDHIIELRGDLAWQVIALDDAEEGLCIIIIIITLS